MRTREEIEIIEEGIRVAEPRGVDGFLRMQNSLVIELLLDIRDSLTKK